MVDQQIEDGVERPVALVTGASRGIGAAIAWRLLEWGADVIVAARGVEGCEAFAARWHASQPDGPRALPLALDVTRAQDVAALPDLALSEFARPITWLVNNAGAAHTAPIKATTDEDYRAALELGFHGPRRLIATLLPTMTAMPNRRRPAIVNIASSAGLHGYAYCTAYCAAKHALVGYTRAAARELSAKDVSMHAIAPHYVDTPMLADSIANVMARTGQTEAQARAFFASENPGGRLIAPGEVAASVLDCLLSPPTPDHAVIELDGSQKPLRR
jgi:NAD(P)-dependent dehydrogenase (short-subunit alcohol dehydrogenase family)